MKNSESLTAVIPFHRLDAYLASAVSSCLEDLKPEDELILINDSLEGEQRVVTWLKTFLEKELPNNVKIKNNHLGGVVAARNLALQNAERAYVSFLDSDDIWISGRRERHLNILNSNKSAPGVSSNVIYICSHGLRIGESRSPSVFIKLLSQELRFFPRLRTSATTIRRDFAIQVGAFQPTESDCEDFGLWLRLQTTHGRFLLDKNFGAKYRLHANQLSKIIGQRASEKLVELTLESLKRGENNEEYKKNRLRLIAKSITRGGLIHTALRGKFGNFAVTVSEMLDISLLALSCYLSFTARSWRRRTCRNCENERRSQ